MNGSQSKTKRGTRRRSSDAETAAIPVASHTNTRSWEVGTPTVPAITADRTHHRIGSHQRLRTSQSSQTRLPQGFGLPRTGHDGSIGILGVGVGLLVLGLIGLVVFPWGGVVVAVIGIILIVAFLAGLGRRATHTGPR